MIFYLLLAALFMARVHRRSSQYALGFAVAVLGLAITSGLWHSHSWGMSAHAELLWERRWVSSFLLAG